MRTYVLLTSIFCGISIGIFAAFVIDNLIAGLLFVVSGTCFGGLMIAAIFSILGAIDENV